MRPASEVQKRFDALQQIGEDVVTIIGGRWDGRCGVLVDRQQFMCVVALDDHPDRVRVQSKHVYRVRE